MKNTDIYSKLTSSAKQTFDEYVENLKDDILYEAYEEVKKENQDSSEIRLKEVISAIRKSTMKNDWQEIEQERYRMLKKRRLYSLGIVIGMFYSLFGLGYYLYTSGLMELKGNLGLVMVILGIMMAVVSYIFGQMSLQRIKIKELTNLADTNTLDSKNMELLKRWQIIENQSKLILEKETDKPITFSEILQFLIINFAKNDNEESEIRELLSARNKIAHKGYLESESELKSMLNLADKLIDNLDKMMKQQ